VTSTDAPQVQATYADHSVPLDEAEQNLREAIAGFETTMREWRDRRATSLVFEPPINVIKIGTGGGKTHEAAAKIAVWLPRGWRIVVAVPNHKLARQVAQTIGAHRLNVEIYRGYTQPDPSAREHKMCRNLPAYEAASDLGVSIRGAVCDRRSDDDPLDRHRCDFIDVCGYWQQQELKPDIWVITHATLLFERPDFIDELDGLVTDEQFFNGGIGKQAEDEDDEGKLGKSQKTNVAALRKRKIEACNDKEQDFLTRLRYRLFDAVRSNGDGYLTRQALLDAEISAKDARRAAVLEQRRVTPKVLTPGMAESKLKDQVTHHKNPNKRARAAGSMWDEIANFLALDHPESGRLKVAGDEITVTRHRPVHQTWRAPTLVLDATAPSPWILQQAIFGDSAWRRDNVTVTDIAIKRPDCVHVRQILEAPVAKKKLGLVSFAGAKPENERDVLRHIKMRAALAAPDKIGLISYKQFIEKISDRLPANVITMWFGALSGRNDMERVAGLIIVGQPTPKPADVENAAEVFTGQPITARVAEHWFPWVDGGIARADGGVVAIKAPRHPDPIVEEFRWQVTEAGLIQADGRMRSVRRTESCWVDILSDIPLPSPADEVVKWKDVCPGAEADMAAEGVILTNTRDAWTVFGVKDHQARKVGNCVGLCNNNYITETHTVSLEGSVEKRTQWSPVRFRYRRGSRGPKSEGLFLPAILPERDLKTWLTDKLGKLASLEIEPRTIWHPTGLVAREPAGMPLGEVLQVVGWHWVELAEADDDEQESEPTPGTT
jgi:hypothetical protein